MVTGESYFEGILTRKMCNGLQVHIAIELCMFDTWDILLVQENQNDWVGSKRYKWNVWGVVPWGSIVFVS